MREANPDIVRHYFQLAIKHEADCRNHADAQAPAVIVRSSEVTAH
jgi:hypothetical protein